MISSAGLAHCRLFQQRDVDPLLFGVNAVGHFEGMERLCHNTKPSITVRLFIAYSHSGSMTKDCVFLYAQISWIMQITMGTSPTETLSVAGNIFVGQVLMSLNTNLSENIFSQIPLHLILTVKGSLMTRVINKNYSSCVCLHVQPVFCAADWGSPADPPIFEGHDQIWDPCCYDWRICHNCRQCHGGIHLIWGEIKRSVPRIA